MFEIAVAIPSRLQSTISGFLEVHEVHAYAAQMLAAHLRHFRFARSYQLVIDVSATKIQSQGVIKAMGEHIATFPRAERVGVVVGKSLNRYQALRLMDRPHVQFCDWLPEAQEWAFGSPLPAGDLTLFAKGGFSQAA